MTMRPTTTILSYTTTHNSIDHGNANTLYSGSFETLSDLGFIVTKTGDTDLERYNSLSHTITIPVSSGSMIGLDVGSIMSWRTEVSGSIIPAIKTEADSAGYTEDQIEEQAQPDVDVEDAGFPQEQS